MLRKTVLASLILFLAARGAAAASATDMMLARAWPFDVRASIGDVGRGVGVVFSPDLSFANNCRFYEALGFACFQDTDWARVVTAIRKHNIEKPERAIRTLIVETHGTNGHGLKLQASKAPKAERSYISVGALQERLEPDGVRYIVLSACNSGRLLRPSIYTTLDPNPGDKLFLPATCGIHNASPHWNPRRSRVVVMTPETSHIETLLAGKLIELTPATRRALTQIAKTRGVRLPKEFAVSDIMIQMMLRDPRLSLRANQHTDEFSATLRPAKSSEELFQSLVQFLDVVAARDSQAIAGKAAIAPAAR